MGTGICLFLLGFAYLFAGKMKFGSLGLGLTNMGMGSTSVHEQTYIFHAQLTSMIYSSSVLSHSYDFENSENKTNALTVSVFVKCRSIFGSVIQLLSGSAVTEHAQTTVIQFNPIWRNIQLELWSLKLNTSPLLTS